MIDFVEIKSCLSFFGLDDADSNVYIHLLQQGPSSVGAVAGKIGMDRGKTYRSVNKLKNMGMVSTTFSNPIITKAVKPQDAFTQLIQQKEDEITTMQKLSRKLIQELDQITNSKEFQSPSTFSIIQGRNNIYARIGKLIQSSTKEVFLITTNEDLVHMYHTAIPEKISNCIMNGGRVRIITNKIDEQTLPLIKKLGTDEIRIGKLPSESRIITENKKQLIMSGSLKESRDPSDPSDSIMYTNSIEMVENMFSLSSHLWKKSKNIELVISQ